MQTTTTHEHQSITEPPNEFKLGTVPQVARVLAISAASVYNLINRGEITTVKIGKSRRIPWGAVQAFIAKNTTNADA